MCTKMSPVVYFIVCVVHLPTSNSNPLFWKVCVQPPAWSCCSRTTTFFPALDKSAAAVKPPTPLPITTASRAGGIRSTRKPAGGHHILKSLPKSPRMMCFSHWRLKKKTPKLLFELRERYPSGVFMWQNIFVPLLFTLFYLVTLNFLIYFRKCTHSVILKVRGALDMSIYNAYH